MTKLEEVQAGKERFLEGSKRRNETLFYRPGYAGYSMRVSYDAIELADAVREQYIKRVEHIHDQGRIPIPNEEVAFFNAGVYPRGYMPALWDGCCQNLY